MYYVRRIVNQILENNPQIVEITKGEVYILRCWNLSKPSLVTVSSRFPIDLHTVHLLVCLTFS
jgi:hypothetical protein